MPPHGVFQLLEINLVSAQNLASVSKSMRTFAVAWLNPERKLATRVDQDGHTNPAWNEKFVFRVDDRFLKADTSVVTIEIYASAWLRDVLIGTVSVLVNDVVPPSSRSQKKSKMRFYALQIRRPSGRPQGILNVGVSLLDSTKRSMPLDSEFSASGVSYWDLMDSKGQKQNISQDRKGERNNCKIRLLRSQSERTDNNGYPVRKTAGSLCNGGSVLSYCSVTKDSDVSGLGQQKCVNGNGSLCSDVGPSPSVVAAAIAKGLHPMHDYDMGSSILEGWTEQDSVEGLKTKIERWRTELPPVYDHERNKFRPSSQRRKEVKKKSKKGGGLFSCFGNAYGCEFSITCGGSGNQKKKFGSGKLHLTSSEMTFDESYD